MTEAASPQTTPTELDIEHGLPPGWGEGAKGKILFWIAVIFASFQIALSVYAILPSQSLRAVHVGFLVLVAAGLIANHRARAPLAFYGGWALGIIGFAVGLYHLFLYHELVIRSDELNAIEYRDLLTLLSGFDATTKIDFLVGVASLVVLFTVAWRLMGAALPLICLAFLAYAFLGQYLPSPLDHRGYGLGQVVHNMAFGTEGIYATPTAVSATYIFLFILFGAFLERAGMIQLFNDVSLGLVGHTRGGAAKVAVFSSALMGTISGSGVANVVTTGQFTIPLMRRFGYRPAFAGGVEATASMGGQIMPPVMGAVAFIMAENIGVPYSEIVKAAILPAILYFASAYWMVHLEAGKHGLHGMAKSELPSPIAAIRRQWHLALPLAVLVYLLMSGYTPLFAGSIGLALTIIMILGGSVALGLPQGAIRTIFWIGLGLVSASFFEFGVFVVVTLVAALIAACLVSRGGRATLILCRDSLADGSRQALAVGLACAIVGVVIGVMTLTGAATTFGNFVVSFGRESIFLCLVLVMITSILLGTGLPTIPTYIITASLAAPALLQLGVPLIVSHMFVFYYGIIADLTPPVALAALAAAPIARASPDAIGWEATRVALAGFLIPFLSVYEPSLMMQNGGWVAAQFGYWTEVAWVFFKACVVIGMSGVAAIGYFFGPISLPERLLAGVAAALIIAQFPYSDASGLLLAALLTAINLMRLKAAKASSARAGATFAKR